MSAYWIAYLVLTVVNFAIYAATRRNLRQLKDLLDERTEATS